MNKEIATERLVLRPWQESDAESLEAVLNLSCDDLG